MFKKIRKEFQCLKEESRDSNFVIGKGRNSNVWQDKVGILIFKRKGWELQCLKGSGDNSNV